MVCPPFVNKEIVAVQLGNSPTHGWVVVGYEVQAVKDDVHRPALEVACTRVRTVVVHPQGPHLELLARRVIHNLVQLQIDARLLLRTSNRGCICFQSHTNLRPHYRTCPPTHEDAQSNTTTPCMGLGLNIRMNTCKCVVKRCQTLFLLKDCKMWAQGGALACHSPEPNDTMIIIINNSNSTKGALLCCLK